MAAPPRERGTPPRLPRAVVALGIVSLFTDASAEMIVPLLPAFLLALGGTAQTLALIEGVADTTAGLFRLISGALADRVARKKPLIVAGYALSSTARPLMALALLPWHVLTVRFLDRVGKGMRGSPRDALVAQITEPSQRGRAFGLHRALDNAGNVVGPLLAVAFLHSLDGPPELPDLRTLFGLAAIPAALALLTLLFLVKEPAHAAAPTGAPEAAAPPRPAFTIRPPAVPALRRFLGAHFLFGLGESTDAFLLLRAAQLGVPLAQLPLFPALLAAVRALLSTPLGALSDRVPRKAVIVAGWSLYALVYAGFALASAPWHAWLLIALYGVHYSLLEGAERAFVAELAPPDARGRAFGAYHFVTAMVALPASLLFGTVMDRAGAPTAFSMGAGLAALGTVALITTVRPPPPRAAAAIQPHA